MRGNTVAIICVLIITVLIFSACGLQNPSNSTQIDHTTPSQKAHIDYAPLVFSSTEELVDTIRNNEQTDERYIAFSLDELGYFYVPGCVPQGFKLVAVEVLEYYILYYYEMDDVSSQNQEKIVCQYYRAEKASSTDSYSVILKQLGIAPTEDGFAYDEKKNSIYFPVGNT